MMFLLMNVVIIIHLVVAVWVLFVVSSQGLAFGPVSRRPESPTWRLTGDSPAPHQVATHVVLIYPAPVLVSILSKNIDNT